MSLLNAVYSVCKEIKSLPMRDDVRATLRALDSGDRGMYGYIARQQNAQVLGYLMVDEKREIINKRDYPTSVPHVDDVELQHLRQAHSIIRTVLSKCTRGLTDTFPALTKPMDPYSLFTYPDYEVNLESSIKHLDLDTLHRTFNRSPATLTIRDLPIDFVRGMKEERFLAAIIEFTKRIKMSGVHDAPPDLVDVLINTKKNTPEHTVQRLIWATLGIRHMLNNIAQLIYQAFRYDTLTVISEDNLLEIQNQNSHWIGDGLTLSTMPEAHEMFIDLGQILLVKINAGQVEIHELTVVDGVSTSFSRDVGNQVTVSLRILDDCLNPFHGLLARNR